MGLKTLSVAELKDRLGRGEVLLVDVREPAEHRSECIEGAKLVPLSEVSLEKIGPSPLPLVLHCRSGRRSEQACRKLLAENPELEIYNLEGGIVAWEAAGYPVRKAKRSLAPMTGWCGMAKLLARMPWNR